jgi:hypothetical protein
MISHPGLFSNVKRPKRRRLLGGAWLISVNQRGTALDPT